MSRHLSTYHFYYVALSEILYHAPRKPIALCSEQRITGKEHTEKPSLAAPKRYALAAKEGFTLLHLREKRDEEGQRLILPMHGHE